MNTKQLVVLVASIALILCVIFLIISTRRAMYNKPWPPVVNECPDKWVKEGNLCKDVHEINTTCPSEAASNNSPTSVNFTTAVYTGHNGKCAKRNYANDCGATWQGITDVPMECESQL